MIILKEINIQDEPEEKEEETVKTPTVSPERIVKRGYLRNLGIFDEPDLPEPPVAPVVPVQTKKRGKGGSGFYEDDKLPVKKGSRGKICQEVQTSLSKMQGSDGSFPYKEILRKGSKIFGSVMSKVNPTDGVYGPRTAMAIRAFYKLEKNENAPHNGEIIDQKVYNDITGNKSSTDVDKQEVATAVAQDKIPVSPSDPVEPVIYATEAEPFKPILKTAEKAAQKVYRYGFGSTSESIIKRRNDQIEKLVFERLVKGCK